MNANTKLVQNPTLEQQQGYWRLTANFPAFSLPTPDVRTYVHHDIVFKETRKPKKRDKHAADPLR